MAQTTFREIQLQHRRMKACERIAHFSNPMLAEVARRYAARLAGWQNMFVPADAGFFAGYLATFRPAFDAVARDAKRLRVKTPIERRLAA